MPKLTAKTVAALREPGRYNDGEGLYLEIAPGGSKSYTLITVVKGKRRQIGLGGVSYTTLAEAREEARRLRKIARRGGDPIAERQREGEKPDFETVARKVYEINRPHWREGGVHV